LVFTPPDHAVPLDNYAAWWKWTPGADWRHPEGPGSSIDHRQDHPVVQIAWDDAVAYANWAGKRLPTEAEWEFAARGGLDGKRFTWGDEPPTPDKSRANIWHGEFPHRNTKDDGYYRTAPVKTYEPNGFGLFDMAGNVWEWCNDWYGWNYYSWSPYDNPTGPSSGEVCRVLRGGSWFDGTYILRCAMRAYYLPDTRSHYSGFRLVLD
jgi:formylglycine-generating enzyme required for sulfatase activity